MLTSLTGGPLGPGNPVGPAGPNGPCKTGQKRALNLSLSEAIIDTLEGFDYYIYRTRSPGGPGGPSLPELPCEEGEEKRMRKGKLNRTF